MNFLKELIGSDNNFDMDKVCESINQNFDYDYRKNLVQSLLECCLADSDSCSQKESELIGAIANKLKVFHFKYYYSCIFSSFNTCKPLRVRPFMNPGSQFSSLGFAKCKSLSSEHHLCV